MNLNQNTLSREARMQVFIREMTTSATALFTGLSLKLRSIFLTVLGFDGKFTILP